jgi:hypothetical protein
MGSRFKGQRELPGIKHDFEFGFSYSSSLSFFGCKLTKKQKRIRCAAGVSEVLLHLFDGLDAQRLAQHAGDPWAIL